MAFPLQTSRTRQRLQRSLFRWLAVNEKRFPFPIFIAHRTDHHLELCLGGINPVIQCRLSGSKHRGWPRSLIRSGAVQHFLSGYPVGTRQHAYAEVLVAVEHAGVCWDLLTSIEILEMHQPDGYCCGLRDQEHRQAYATRDALWREELFEPFLAWVTETLAQAECLVLYKSDGATWATLEGNNGFPPAKESALVVARLPVKLAQPNPEPAFQRR